MSAVERGFLATQTHLFCAELYGDSDGLNLAIVSSGAGFPGHSDG